MKLKGLAKRLMVCWRVLTTHSYFTFFCTKNQLHKTAYVNELPWSVYREIRDKADSDTKLYDGVFNFSLDAVYHKISDDILKGLGFELKARYGFKSEMPYWTKRVGENKVELEYFYDKCPDKDWHIKLFRKDDNIYSFGGYVGTVDDMCAFFDFAGIDFDFYTPHDSTNHELDEAQKIDDYKDNNNDNHCD